MNPNGVDILNQDTKGTKYTEREMLVFGILSDLARRHLIVAGLVAALAAVIFPVVAALEGTEQACKVVAFNILAPAAVILAVNTVLLAARVLFISKPAEGTLGGGVEPEGSTLSRPSTSCASPDAHGPGKPMVRQEPRR